MLYLKYNNFKNSYGYITQIYLGRHIKILKKLLNVFNILIFFVVIALQYPYLLYQYIL